ncbi:unnamed protein product [Acanthoscelides obtectus]|uniref:DDE Tnp4 domain-containing protein n=1 Tax=Acanthoscelides obtectus TaxID=200917 RepID=A0A9P0KFM0_ACAOB|nr:unnamed protein product [Acanthoscelides obtectus]CAK1680347.1 hypothetical protein AOBTE_LOCUS32589 [Acanthoscelides obtectus]
MLYYLAMTVMVLSHDMSPFRNPTPGAEINYNKLLKQERVIIERCFGQLKCQFPILQYVCRVKLENVPKIIIACIVLHNVAKSLGDPDFELVEQDPHEDEGNHENDELPLRQLGANFKKTNLLWRFVRTFPVHSSPTTRKAFFELKKHCLDFDQKLFWEYGKNRMNINLQTEAKIISRLNSPVERIRHHSAKLNFLLGKQFINGDNYRRVMLILHQYGIAAFINTTHEIA